MNTDNTDKPKQPVKTNLPIIGFLSRYWVLILIFTIFVSCVWIKPIMKHLGQFVYFPMYCFGVFLMALLLRHIFHYYTSDEDARNGTFSREWDALPPEKRVQLTIDQFKWYILSISIIAAALIK